MTLGHEWHEMMSDQNPAGGWTNHTGSSYNGQENSDECAWISPGHGRRRGERHLRAPAPSPSRRQLVQRHQQLRHQPPDRRRRHGRQHRHGHQPGQPDRHRRHREVAADPGERLGRRPDADLQRDRPARRRVDQLLDRPDLGHADHGGAPTRRRSPRRTAPAPPAARRSPGRSRPRAAAAAAAGQKLAQPRLRVGRHPLDAELRRHQHRRGARARRLGLRLARRVRHHPHRHAVPVGGHPGRLQGHADLLPVDLDTAETTTTTAYDKLTLTANGTSKQTFSNLNKGTGYAVRTVDLSSLRRSDGDDQVDGHGGLLARHELLHRRHRAHAGLTQHCAPRSGPPVPWRAAFARGCGTAGTARFATGHFGNNDRDGKGVHSHLGRHAGHRPICNTATTPGWTRERRLGGGRALPRARTDRLRRHGRGLPRPGRGARPPGRRQGLPRRARRVGGGRHQRARHRAPAARSGRAGPAEPPESDRAVRRLARRRTARVHRDGAHRGPVAGRPHRRGPVAGGLDARDRHPAGRRSGLRPRAGHGAPRREARKHPAGCRPVRRRPHGACPVVGLRHRAAARHRATDERELHTRHGVLPRARAGARVGGRPAGRHLLAGAGAARGLDRAAHVRRAAARGCSRAAVAASRRAGRAARAVAGAAARDDRVRPRPASHRGRGRPHAAQRGLASPAAGADRRSGGGGVRRGTHRHGRRPRCRCAARGRRPLRCAPAARGVAARAGWSSPPSSACW